MLRLLEDFRLDDVRGAVQDAVRLGAIGFDAVKHLVRCRLDHRPPHLDLAQYPHLPVARVATTAARELPGTPGGRVMTKPTLLLDAHLKALRLPTFLREYDKVARHGAQEGLDCPRYLFRLCELELLDREPRAVERRIKAAKFPVLKSLETFEFPAIPSLNKRLVLELARSEYLDRRENVLALGNSGTGKTHLALALGRAACQQGYRVRFTTAAALVNDLLEARDDKRLLRLQKQLAKQDLLIVDELGYVPLSKTTAELLFEIFSQRYEQASTLVTSNLPFKRMDRDLRLRTPHRRAARPADPSRPHPRAQRRQLPPRTQQEGPPPRGLPGALTPPPHDGAGCAHGFPLRLSPPQGRSQTPLQPVRTTALRHSAQRPGGLVFLRHRGLILLRP